jgi:hypothetical protein
MSGCLKCRGPVQQPPTGRPRSYCSDTCKRLARYERDRLQRHLQSLEGSLIRLRALGMSKPAYLQAIQAEIDAAEVRLGLLLGAEQEPVSG